jgi:hypothetical protein
MTLAGRRYACLGAALLFIAKNGGPATQNRAASCLRHGVMEYWSDGISPRIADGINALMDWWNGGLVDLLIS